MINHFVRSGPACYTRFTAGSWSGQYVKSCLGFAQMATSMPADSQEQGTRRPRAPADFSGNAFEIDLSELQRNSPLDSCGSTTGESQWLGSWKTASTRPALLRGALVAVGWLTKPPTSKNLEVERLVFSATVMLPQRTSCLCACH